MFKEHRAGKNQLLGTGLDEDSSVVQLFTVHTFTEFSNSVPAPSRERKLSTGKVKSGKNTK